MNGEHEGKAEFAYSLEELLDLHLAQYVEEEIEDYRVLWRSFYRDHGYLLAHPILREGDKKGFIFRRSYLLEVLATIFITEPEQHPEILEMSEDAKRRLFAYAAVARKFVLDSTIRDIQISQLAQPELVTEKMRQGYGLAQKESAQLEVFINHLVEPAGENKSGSPEARG